MTSNAEIEYVIIYLILLRLNERSKIVVAVQCPCGIVLPPSKNPSYNSISLVASLQFLYALQGTAMSCLLTISCVVYACYASLITLFF